MSRSFTVTAEEDPETGDIILPIPPELITELGWQESDRLNFDMQSDGSCVISNIDAESRNDD